jgi:hypothetical protein
VALGIATGVTSVLYLNQRSSYNEEGRHDPDVTQAANEQDSLRTLGVVNAVLWIATAGAAGLTGYLYFTRPERPRDTAGLSLSLAPTRVGVSFAGSL